MPKAFSAVFGMFLLVLPVNLGRSADIEIPEVQGFRDTDFQPSQDIPRIIRWFHNQYSETLFEQDRTLLRWSNAAQKEGSVAVSLAELDSLKKKVWAELHVNLSDNLVKILGNFLKLERDVAKMGYELSVQKKGQDVAALKAKYTEAEKMYQDFLKGFLPTDLMGLQ